MTTSLLSLAKHIGGPGSIGFLAMCSAIGLVVGRLGPRARRLGRLWLVGLYCSYLVLGLPIVANSLATRLTVPPSTHETPPSGSVLVVLDGDNALGRVREARQVFDTASPAWVIVSGRRWFVDQVIESGIPKDRIVTDFNATTTRGQIANLPGLLRGRDASGIIVVASRLQMPRVAGLTGGLGVPTRLAPSPIDIEPSSSGVWQFVPTYSALRVSRDALYELAAIAYYRRQHWMS